FHQWLFYYLIYYWGFIDWILRLFGTWLRNLWRWLYYSLFARLINGGSYFRVRWILTSCFLIFFRFNYFCFRTRLYCIFYRPRRVLIFSCFIIFFRFNYLRFRTRLYGRFYRP